jgi:hypothetical protein
MSQATENRSGAESKGNEEGVPEIRVKQDKVLLLLIILMAACIGIICFVPFFVEVYTGGVTVYFRFWASYNPTSGAPSWVEPWFTDSVGIFGFATGLGMLALTGVSFTIALMHKINKKLFLEKGAIIPFIIAGFSSFIWICGLFFPPWNYGRLSWGPISEYALGACGVLTLVLANVFRVGPWLRAPVSWKEAILVKTMEASIFPILVVLKKLQEMKGEIDLNLLSQIYGRMRGTIKLKLQRAMLTNLIKGHFTGPFNFFLETINLPFIIDDDDIPQMIRATVDSMLARATAAPSAGIPMATTPVTSVQPITSSVVRPVAAGQLAPTGGAVLCPGCGANVAGKEFCTNCGRKVPVESIPTVTSTAAAPAGGAMFCASCGASLKADAAFCPSCGTKVT